MCRCSVRHGLPRGDYLSPDLKNTVDELADYDPSIDHLLDEVFDQYGLIVCGWSGIWDTALRNAILRASNRRFATCWLHRGQVSPEVSVREDSETVPVAIAAASWKVGKLYSSERRKTPISDHILNLAGPVVHGIVSDQDRLEDLFDEVEYLMGIAYMAGGLTHAPHGRAAWRSFPSDQYPGAVVKRHAQVLVASGVFDGDEQMARTCEAYDEQLRSSPSRWR